MAGVGATANVPGVRSKDRDVDVLREAADEPEGFRERRPTFEEQARPTRRQSMNQGIKRPAHSVVQDASEPLEDRRAIRGKHILQPVQGLHDAHGGMARRTYGAPSTQLHASVGRSSSLRQRPLTTASPS